MGTPRRRGTERSHPHHPHLHRRSAAVAMVFTTVLFVGSLAPPALAAFPSTTDQIRNWIPEHIAGSHTHTKTKAIATAKATDVVVAVRGAYQGLVDDMKAANPDLVVLVYLNGAYAQKNQASLYPSAWYARDASGNKVVSSGYGNYLMTPSNTGWVGNVVDMCAKFRSEGGYDGCFLDMLGTSTLDPGYLSSQPINPATGKVWTTSKWIRATAALAKAVKTKVGSHLVTANGLRSGRYYYDSSAPSSTLLGAIDGGCAESWLRMATENVGSWPTKSAWLHDVNMLVDAGSKGKTVLAMVKLWTSATSAQQAQWHRFALGSFLLGNTGSSYFFFSASRTSDLLAPDSLTNVSLGAPTSSYQLVNGLYQRTFQNGIVLVNVSGSALSASLSKTYVTQSGKRVSSLSVAGHDSEILLNS